MRFIVPVRFLALGVVLTSLSAYPRCAMADGPQRHPDQSDIARIKQLRDQKAWFPALESIESLASRFPDNNDLYVLRVHTLGEIGARQKAWELFRARPQLFTAEETQRIELDRLAAAISGSMFYAGTPEARRAAGLEAEHAVQDYLQRSGTTTVPQRLRYDRMLLLNELKRHDEVVAEYERARAEGLAVPAYVAAAVGDSLLALRRPVDAHAALQIATTANPGDTNWGIQQAYALSEAERFAPALEVLDRHVAGNAPWLLAPGSRQAYPNWKRYDAQTNRALMASYAEDLPGAQAALEPMLAIAPKNSGLHAALGTLYTRRGWTGRGLRHQRIASTLDPDNVSALIGQSESLMQLQRDDLAAPIVAELGRRYPDAMHVQRLQNDWQRHRGWRWQVETAASESRGTGANSPQGAEDAHHAFAIESPLIDDRWRIVAGADDRSAEFGGRTVRDRRGWAGVDYAFDRLGWRLVANRSVDALDSSGLAFDLQWRFSDTLDGGLVARHHDPEASLQARAAGIQADTFGASLAWNRDERTGVTAAVQQSRYDDGNRRDSVSLRHAQRLLTRAHVLLTGTAGVYASRGSRDDAPYFNPRRDTSFEYTLKADHLAWRRYERHFRHRLAVTAGQYRQDGFDSAWIASAQYEHEWRFAPGRVLTYGARWGKPVYDGNREEHLGVYAGFTWGE